MKKLINLLPVILLLISFITHLVSVFKSANAQLANTNIILCISLLVFIGYQQYLSKLEQPDLKKELDGLRLVMGQAINKQKDETEKAILKINDEMGKISLAVGSKTPNAVKTANDKKIIF